MHEDLRRLKRYRRQLSEAIDELEHEIRRCRDALERSGGRSAVHEARLDELRGARDLNQGELDRVTREIEQSSR